MKLNHHFEEISESYLFAEVSRRVQAYRQSHPDHEVISLGIGDVTRPLCTVATQALVKASQEQGTQEGFHGYGPEQGYPFLREAVQAYYRSMGAEVQAEDIFISDGAKSDLGNFLDLFDRENTVLIPDPVYPVYRDTNQMAGRPIRYLNAVRENGFLPMPEEGMEGDIIYLCSPNNPAGVVYTREQLQKWVDFALEHDAVIFFDAAYEGFIRDSSLPRSIFTIPGADRCAVEFCSFSKLAGFTGLRCGYTVVPHTLMREGMSLRKMWLRRQTTKFNGVPYPVQRAAAAVLTPEGLAQCRESIEVYRQNAALISQVLQECGIWHTGGAHSPYLWLECPGKMDSWEFFDMLLEKADVVGTPGSGFGKNGEGYFRLTGFGTPENTQKAMERFRKVFG